MAAGSIVLLLGVAALLGSLNLINFGELWSTWWPSLLIIGGVLLFIHNRKDYLWPLILVVVGVLWQSDMLFENIEVNIWQIFWPLVLIAIGWSILVNRTGSRATTSNDESVSAILGGTETKNTDKDYRGSRVTTIMGGSVIDLRHAHIKKEATIEIFALMGGIELRIPEGWTVKTSVLPVLGGVEDKSVRALKDGAPVLNVVGNVILGGVEIKN